MAAAALAGALGLLGGPLAASEAQAEAEAQSRLQAQAQTKAASCTADDFARAVDASAASLRAFNAEQSPKLQAALKRLKEKKGWKGANADDLAYAFLQDARMQSLDQQANELYVNIDGLGQTPSDGPLDCSRLTELRAASSELLAVMRAKAAHSLQKIDAEVGGTAASPKVAAQPKPQPPAPGVTAPIAPAPSLPAPKAPDPKAPAAKTGEPREGWSTATEAPPLPPPAPPLPTAPPIFELPPEEDGYTIDEIREASRGFFGPLSTELAAVIEHAFRNTGRPSAYILGTEGGGAFLAGVRYGKGTLYPRRGAARDIWWHGPSVGYDLGAEGSRTLFLIYGLHDIDAIYRRFAGIDGSAYLVGGVGITYLRGGQVVLAPIRTGIGLRLGASVGYLRFTPRATWNPF